jgi:hypothetical protein
MSLKERTPDTPYCTHTHTQTLSLSLGLSYEILVRERILDATTYHHNVTILVPCKHHPTLQYFNTTAVTLADAQAVIRRPSTAEARVRSRASPCGVCGGQSGTGTGFSPSCRFFPVNFIPLVLHYL